MVKALFPHAEQADRRGGIPATDDGEGWGGRHRLGHGACALSERRHLEDAHGAIPDDRASIRQRLGVGRGGRRSDVEAHPPRRDGIGGDHHDLGVSRELISHDDVDGQEELNTALLCVGHDLPHRGNHVFLEEGIAHLEALRREEGERHPTADQEPIDVPDEIGQDGQLVRDLGST